MDQHEFELFADVYPVPDGDGAVEGFDILCVLDQANDIPRPDCLNADIYPCDGGDGAIEGFDILAVLDTASHIGGKDHHHFYFIGSSQFIPVFIKVRGCWLGRK